MISMVRALVICGELGSQSVKEYFSLFLSVSRHQIDREFSEGYKGLGHFTSALQLQKITPST